MKKTEKPSKGKRILALAGVILLIGLYVVTFICAIFTTPAAKGLFMACIFATVAVPVMGYAYILVYRVLKKKKEETDA